MICQRTAWKNQHCRLFKEHCTALHSSVMCCNTLNLISHHCNAVQCRPEHYFPHQCSLEYPTAVQSIAVKFSTVQCSVYTSVVKCNAPDCSANHFNAVYFSVLQCIPVYCSVLQCSIYCHGSQSGHWLEELLRKQVTRLAELAHFY